MTARHRAPRPAPHAIDRGQLAAGLLMVLASIALIVLLVTDLPSSPRRLSLAEGAIAPAPSSSLADFGGPAGIPGPPDPSTGITGPPDRIVAPVQTPRQYVIKQGDTLTGIAAQLVVPLAQLEATNTATIGGNPNLIHPGQILALP